jgi:membrane-bound lytic murein transglycosylase B
MTTTKRTISPLLLVTFSSLTFANTISDEAMKKALEGVKTIRVMEENEPKTISKTIVTEKQKSSLHKASKKRFAKKKVSKKRIKKRVIKKKIQNIDFSKLKDVQTLGVLSTSKPFELKQ